MDRSSREDAPLLAPPSMQTLRTIGALILREMGSRYGRSPGGYIWALLSPIGTITVLVLAFSLVVRQPALGKSFALYYATGFLPFSLYAQVASVIGGALRYSRALLAYPRVTWLDAVLARFILNTMVAMTASCIVFLGIMVLIERPAQMTFAPILAAISIAALLALGVGLLNCLLTGFFPVWERIWSIITTPMFLASGIFFLYEEMPPVAQNVLWWNPLMHVTALFRSGFYTTYRPGWVEPLYCYGLALGLILFGMIFLRSGYRATFEK